MSKPVKINPFLTDEPSISPPSPGDALIRLSQILGILSGTTANANPVPVGTDDWKNSLFASRQALITAVESGAGIGSAFEQAQKSVRDFYDFLTNDIEDINEVTSKLTAFGFPDPQNLNTTWVGAVDISTIVVTHFKPERQVMTTIAFGHAFGAEAYWLREAKFFGEQRSDENVVQNFAPIFQRVRLPIGKHLLYIQSRNHHRSVYSEEFEIEVPAL